MNMWYLRDRGKVMGPLTADTVRTMRAAGQIQDFHEASADRRVWRAVGLVPELCDAPPRPGPPAHAAPARPPDRVYIALVAGLASVVLLGASVVGGVLLLRPGREPAVAASNPTAPAPAASTPASPPPEPAYVPPTPPPPAYVPPTPAPPATVSPQPDPNASRRASLQAELQAVEQQVRALDAQSSDLSGKLLLAEAAEVACVEAYNRAQTPGERTAANIALAVARATLRELQASFQRVESQLRDARSRVAVIRSELTRLG